MWRVNKQFWIFLAVITLILPFHAQSIEAQDTIVCEQNSPYWERWQENADFRARMTGSMWNVTNFDVSPDGNTLAVTNRNSLTLYDTQTLTPQKQLASMNVPPVAGYPGSYRGVNWSPD